MIFKKGVHNMIESNKIKIPQEAFTHAGKFHSDDVFSAALLTYLNPDIKIKEAMLFRRFIVLF